MKLVTNTQMTLDGVVQGNGGRNEDRSGGFERGGWAWALTDSEDRKFVEEFYQRATHSCSVGGPMISLLALGA